MIRPIELAGSDNHMDHRDPWGNGPGLNPLPPSCPTCRFPDLDFVPSPYFLLRSRARSSNEFAEAELGNLLVKSRVKAVFEAVVPGICDFYPTFFLKSQERTPWFLAVPKRYGTTGIVAPRIRRCDDCGQPKSAHGTQYESRDIRSHYDLAKSLNWFSDVAGWSRWIHRDTLVSVRLYWLLKRLKVKDFYEATGGSRPETEPNAQELQWIDDRLRMLRHLKPSKPSTRTLSPEEQQWLDAFIASRPPIAPADATHKPLQCQWAIPPSFDFLFSRLGPISFDNVDAADDRVTLYPPSEWRLLEPEELQDDAPEAPVAFASSQGGDDLCFDTAAPGPEFPVYRYLHEGDYFEPYTDNFVQALIRFTAENQ